MAVQTKPFVRMSRHGQVIFEVFMEYQDDDFKTVNDDGDPDDFRVIRWFGENFTDSPVGIEWLRGNGQSWRSASLAPHSTFSQNAGGPVKYESDVHWRFS